MSDISYGYCHCGCGDKTSISTRSSTRERTVKGEPKRFIRNHCGSLSSGKDHPTWKGGRTEERGYIRILVDSGKKPYSTKYRYEHVLVMEAFLGISISPKLCVHHIDENKSNNKIENLLLLTDQEHLEIHAALNAYKATGDANQMKCSFCHQHDHIHNMVERVKADKPSRYVHKKCESNYYKNRYSAKKAMLENNQREE